MAANGVEKPLAYCGGDGALEVLMFPPALKGAGEGSFGWDPKPNSILTNATVADAVKGERANRYRPHGKDKKIAIPRAHTLSPSLRLPRPI